MAKQILFDKEAKEKLRRGVNLVANAAGVTLGYGGKYAAIANGYGQKPITTKDGVTVVRHAFVEDEIENVGVMTMRYACERTLEECGDGTTTSAVLAQSMINDGLDHVFSGANSQQIKVGMEKAVKSVIESLKSSSIKLNDIDTIRNVATISANNDEEIGGLIASAYEKIGNDGVLTIEKSKSADTYISVVNGTEMLSGWSNERFVTNKKDMTVEYNDPLIYVADYELKTISQMENLLRSVGTVHNLKEKAFVVIAKGFEGEVYNTFVHNRVNAGAQVCLIAAPFNLQRDTLIDIAVATGAKLVTDLDGYKVENSDVSFCGTCKKIVVTKTTTTIVDGAFDAEQLEARKNEVRFEIEQTEDEKIKEMQVNRLARLSGNIGVIYVGGATDLEQKERYDRVDDATRAVKSAIEEGIVAGGGIALIRAVKAIDIDTYEKDEKLGALIISNACYAPLRKILINSGHERPEFKNIFIKKIFRFLDFIGISIRYKSRLSVLITDYNSNYGFNVKSGEYCDMIEAKIIDPLKVVRCALQNSASVAAQVINTDVLLVEMKPKN